MTAPLSPSGTPIGRLKPVTEEYGLLGSGWMFLACVPVGFHTSAMSSVSDSDAELSSSALDNHQLTGFVLH